MDYICQCGCGEVIPPKPRHRYAPPKYIPSHYHGLTQHARLDRLREAKLAGRTKPPDGWVPPSGLCECGCGQTTGISDKTRPSKGEYLGYPYRYCRGHHMRGKRGETHPQWNGGRYRRKQGYILLKMPDYPGASKQGYVLEHRMVYEQSRGVTLPPKVVIHHINGVKDDNRPENLVAVSRVEHVRAHRLASALISLFLDDRLLDAARAHVREHGEMPDIEALTERIYSSSR